MIHDGFQSDLTPNPDALGVDGVTEQRRPRRKAAPTKVAALNITAMMDLVLNLLLFFVLSASFALAEGGLPADVAGGIGPSDKGPEFTIALHAYGDQAMVDMNGSVARLDADALYRQLNDWRFDEKHPDGVFRATHPILIKPDRNVQWSKVVEVFNALVRARYSDVSLADVES